MNSDNRAECEARTRLLCVDLERRVREGDREVAIQLLAANEDVAADDELALELIYCEFVVLEDLGARPDKSAYIQRHARWQKRLQRVLSIHDALDGSTSPELGDATIGGDRSTASVPLSRPTFRSCAAEVGSVRVV